MCLYSSGLFDAGGVIVVPQGTGGGWPQAQGKGLRARLCMLPPCMLAGGSGAWQGRMRRAALCSRFPLRRWIIRAAGPCMAAKRARCH